MRRLVVATLAALLLSVAAVAPLLAQGYLIELRGVSVGSLVVERTQWLGIGVNTAVADLGAGEIHARVSGRALLYPATSGSVITCVTAVAYGRATAVLSPVKGGDWSCNASCTVSGSALTMVMTGPGIYTARVCEGWNVPPWILLGIAVAAVVVLIVAARKRRSLGIAVPY